MQENKQDPYLKLIGKNANRSCIHCGGETVFSKPAYLGKEIVCKVCHKPEKINSIDYIDCIPVAIVNPSVTLKDVALTVTISSN
jgi:hypothetical protein